MLRVALKYCGGCNPDYDRVAVAESIHTVLDGRVEFRAANDCSAVDMVIVLAGCETASADLKVYVGCEIVEIHSDRDAERRLAAIIHKLTQGQPGG